MKTLYIFVAHIDDLEFSCLGYLLNNEYNKIKIVISTTWKPKTKVFNTNLNILNKYKKLEYVNLGFDQRLIPTHFDKVKNAFYKQIDFTEDFDILTHDKSDAHTDHKALHEIALGLYKYTNRFITIYSPEAINFTPNYFIELSKEQLNLKKQLLDNYNFNEEQSYTKKGKYFEDNRINISTFYALENFHNKDMEGCEIYKIHKWL
tara:strand:- start:10 stop:624 length:615 start_codon:yes stop_codon:yes gene_type:complete